MTRRTPAAYRAEWLRIAGVFAQALAILALGWLTYQTLTGIHAATHAPAAWRAMQ